MPDATPETGAETFACPTCGRPVLLAEALRPATFPFCAARCRDRDFGRWLDGAYAVSGESLGEDPEAAPDQDRDRR